MAASAFTGLHLHIKVLLWLLTGTYEGRLYNPSTKSILESPYLICKKPVSISQSLEPQSNHFYFNLIVAEVEIHKNSQFSSCEKPKKCN